MKKLIKIFKNAIFIGTSTFVITISTSCQKPVITKRMLYGNVITLDSNNNKAEAVGVDINSGKIYFIGTKDEANKRINNQTEVVDYHDNYIYPGFIDAHSHPGALGSAIAGGCLCTPDMNNEQTLEVFREYIQAHPEQELYKCYGSYVANKLGKKEYHYTYKMLDEKLGDLTGKKPVLVIDYGGHSGCLNSAGIAKLEEKLGRPISVSTIKNLKMMDTIELEDLGSGEEINGNISETPAYSFYYSIPETVAELKEGILTQQENVLAPMGYTTLGDCSVQYFDIPTVIALSELGAEGKLKFKIRSFYIVMETDNLSAKEQINIALNLARRYNNEFFKIIGIKTFIDGVTEKNTCYTIEKHVNNPYIADYPKGYYGIFRWDENWRPVVNPGPSMEEIIVEANKHNLSVTAHAFGDAAVRYMLDCYEKARKVLPYNRNSISHCAYVHDDDIDRFRELQVSPVVAPHWAMRTEAADAHEGQIFGEYDEKHPNERSLQKMYKIKTFINNDPDTHISFHTDGMCPDGVPYMLYTGVNRVDPDNADPNIEGYIGPRDANEDVTPMEALTCMSKNPAYLLQEDKNIGSIELNKCGDFSIYPVDFTNPDNMKQENHEIAHTKLIATYVNGKLAYTIGRNTLS